MTRYFPLLLPLFAIATVWIVEGWGSRGSPMLVSGMDMEAPSGERITSHSFSDEGGRVERATSSKGKARGSKDKSRLEARADSPDYPQPDYKPDHNSDNKQDYNYKPDYKPDYNYKPDYKPSYDHKPQYYEPNYMEPSYGYQYQPEYPEYQEEYYPPPQPQYSYKAQYYPTYTYSYATPSYSYSPPKSYSYKQEKSYNSYPQSEYEDYSYKCTDHPPPDCMKKDDPAQVKCSCTESNSRTGCFLKDCIDDDVAKGYVCICNSLYYPKNCVQIMRCGYSYTEWFAGTQEKQYSYSYEKPSYKNDKDKYEAQQQDAKTAEASKYSIT